MSYSEIVKYHMVVCNILLLDKFLSEIKKFSPNTLLISQKHLTVESYLSLQQNEQLESNMLNYIINSIKGICASKVEYTTGFYLNNKSLENFLILAKNNKTEQIFVPIYVENNHYSLAVYNVKRNILEYFDPAERNTLPKKLDKIIEVFETVFKMKPVFRKNDNIPKQKVNSNDCGIFVCWYIKAIYTNKKLGDVRNVNTDAIRKHFLLEVKNIVYNNTGGDLSKLDEVWTFEEDVDVMERIDIVDRTEVVQNDLLPSENCEVKKDIEVVDSIFDKTEQELGNDSKNKKLENNQQLLHNPLEIMNSNLDKVLEEEEIDKIEELFEKNQTYYGADVDRNNNTCNTILETIPVNLLDTLQLQDRLDYLEGHFKNKSEDELHKILQRRFEKDRQCTFIQLRNLPAVLRKLSSDKEESWKLLENVIKLKPIIALSLVARAKYPSHAPHRFHYGNRKCFLRFKNIVERVLPGMLVNDPKAN